MLEKLPENVEANFSITGEVTFPQGTTVSYTRIVKRIWHYGVSVFLVFFISLSVYPAVTVLVESQYKGKGYAWSGKFDVEFRISCSKFLTFVRTLQISTLYLWSLTLFLVRVIILEEYYQEFFNGCVERTVFYSKHSAMHTLKHDFFFII